MPHVIVDYFMLESRSGGRKYYKVVAKMHGNAHCRYKTSYGSNKRDEDAS